MYFKGGATISQFKAKLINLYESYPKNTYYIGGIIGGKKLPCMHTLCT